MTRRQLLSAAAVGPLLAQPRQRPNILLVLADDLGYGDLGCYGGVARTPNLDRFAKEGVRFTNCYSGAPNCSPSRSALMTGRTPTRLGVHNWIPMMSPMHLRKEEITIASLLRKAGYATCHSGKWHMNGLFNLPGQPQPNDHGFDYWFSAQNNALPNHHNPYNFVRNGIPVGPLEGYSAQLVAREAVQWLKNVRDPAKPFFQFVCFHEPHEPIATDARFRAPYGSQPPSFAAYQGSIAQMDAGFGELMAALESGGLRENTLVFFTSDNGPAITNVHPHGSAGPLRDKKGSVYEGGIRVPGMARWPGKTPAGLVSDEPVWGPDFLPSVCDITGIREPADRRIDGTSFAPALEGRPIARRSPLYWHFNQSHAKPKVAMRIGDWKILATLTGPELGPTGAITAAAQQAIKTAELDRFELYNLRDDVSEKHDLSATESARLQELAGVLRKLYADVRTESPTWPEFDFATYNYEAPRIKWPNYRTPGTAR